jgi:hypothetical protein
MTPKRIASSARKGGRVHTEHTQERPQWIASVAQVLSGRPLWPALFGDVYAEASALQQAYRSRETLAGFHQKAATGRFGCGQVF